MSSLDEEELFKVACQIDSPEAREAYLRDECGGDQRLVERLTILLQIFDQESRFLESPALSHALGAGLAEEDSAPVATLGEQIGPYKLLQQIGEGGMGVVYLAEQARPVQRKVAIKVIKPGMDSRQVIARFEAERQALALMDHPNIAKVLDAGTTETGRPYFVMELVKGQPITDYCDSHRLTLRQRLELFIPVCQAIQHAHQKGVIHRDIKPSNILIAPYDGRPVVKLIDFGVAKATGLRLTERTLFTQFGAVLGTLEYMSPEQAELNNQDIDTRSDIYSLGVLLYQLLTGATPLDRARLKSAAFDELLRVIREEEPARPSNRLSQLSQTLPTISAQRRTEPGKLSKLLAGELDWIVMKSLDKERSRRYESAGTFADDVQRYLDDEPVVAGPPSSAYRLRKLVRRNRGKLLATALLATAIFAAVAVVGWGIRDRAAQRADDARSHQERLIRTQSQVDLILAETNQLMQQQKWSNAFVSVRRAEAVLAAGERSPERQQSVKNAIADLEFVQDLDDIRAKYGSIWGELNAEMVSENEEYKEAFQRYDIEIDERPRDEIVARIKSRSHIMLPVISAIDDWISARNLLKDEVGSRRLLDVVLAVDDDSWRNQIRQAMFQGDWVAVRRLIKSDEFLEQPAPTMYLIAASVHRHHQPGLLEILHRAHKKYPDDFWINTRLGVTLIWEGLSHEGIGYVRAAIALRPHQPVAVLNLGKGLLNLGRIDDAIECFKKAIELNPRYATAYNNLGNALSRQLKTDEAMACTRKALEIDPKHAASYRNLGGMLRNAGQLEEAISCYRKALEIAPIDWHTNRFLGDTLRDNGQLDEAITCHRKALALDPNFAEAYNSLGVVLCETGQLDEGLACYRKAVELAPDFALAHSNLGNALMDKGQLDEAIACYRKAVELGLKSALSQHDLGVGLRNKGQLDEALACARRALELDPNFATAHNSLGIVLREMGQMDEGLACHRKAVELAPSDPVHNFNLGRVLYDKGELDEAIACYRKALACYKRALEQDAKLATFHRLLGVALNVNRQFDEAIACYQEALALDPNSAPVHINLGDALANQGRFAESLEAYKRGHELGSKQLDWRHPSAEWVRMAEARAAMEAKLSAFLNGEFQPGDNQERLGLANVGQIKKLNHTATRLYASAFAADSKLADDLQAGHRYNAACAAVLAAVGQGNDAGQLDDAERTRLRNDARNWLRADLALWTKQLETSQPADRANVQKTLLHWRKDTDLAAIRDDAALAALPVDEQQAWNQLWGDVAALLKRAAEKPN